MKQVKVFALAKKDAVGTQRVHAGDTVRYVVECPVPRAEEIHAGETVGYEMVLYETTVKEVTIKAVFEETATHWYVSIDEVSEAQLCRPRVDELTKSIIRQEVRKGIKEERERVEKEALEGMTLKAQARALEDWKKHPRNRLFAVTNSALDELLNVLGIKGPSTVKTALSKVLFEAGRKGDSFNKHDCGWREGADVPLSVLGANTRTYTVTLNGEEGRRNATILIHINPDTLTGVVELEIGPMYHFIETLEFRSDPIERLNEWGGEDE